MALSSIFATKGKQAAVYERGLKNYFLQNKKIQIWQNGRIILFLATSLKGQMATVATRAVSQMNCWTNNHFEIKENNIFQTISQKNTIATPKMIDNKPEIILHGKIHSNKRVKIFIYINVK